LTDADIAKAHEMRRRTNHEVFLKADAELQHEAYELPLIIEGDTLPSSASTKARPPPTNVRLSFDPTPRFVGMTLPLHGNAQTSFAASKVNGGIG
jgi:hypothetical protein